MPTAHSRNAGKNAVGGNVFAVGGDGYLNGDVAVLFRYVAEIVAVHIPKTRAYFGNDVLHLSVFVKIDVVAYHYAVVKKTAALNKIYGRMIFVVITVFKSIGKTREHAEKQRYHADNTHYCDGRRFRHY